MEGVGADAGADEVLPELAGGVPVEVGPDSPEFGAAAPSPELLLDPPLSLGDPLPERLPLATLAELPDRESVL